MMQNMVGKDARTNEDVIKLMTIISVAIVNEMDLKRQGFNLNLI